MEERNLKKKIFVLLVSIALLVGIFSGCTETETNVGPEASFTAPDPAYVNTELSFTDASTDDLAVETWAWNFGDEVGTSTEQNPMYTYTEVGTYTVTLKVTDEAGLEDTATQTIDITLKDIVTTAIDSGFSTLATALEAADLITTLQGEGPYTVFAPTDDAFAAVNQTWLTALLDDTTNLTKVLTYHVVADEVLAAEITDGLTVMTLEETNLTFTVDTGGNVTIDSSATVTTTDIECSNGYIHIIDTVLIPASVNGPTE